MMPQQPPFRWALLLLAFMITLVALVFASPEKTVELNTLGESAVNTAPAIRIKLAGEPAPKPEAAPKSEPEPQPEPKPEPVPEPQVAETTPAETEDNNAEEEVSAQPLTQGAKGMAGDPGKGVHQSGDTENALNKYLAKVRDTIDYNKQYPHRAKMRRQQGTVKVSFVINASGRAEQVEITESSGSRILDRATRELVARLRFDAPPKELDSGSVPVKVIAPVDYDLSNS